VRALALAIAAVALAAGCGGNASETTPASTPPKLPRALAQSWAQQADAIAAALAAGDGCTAEAQAAALRTEVVQAAGDGRIARRRAAPLVGAVNNLPLRIPCAPAPPPTKHGGKHQHKDKHGKHGGGD
jgi:hypothetical protein